MWPAAGDPGRSQKQDISKGPRKQWACSGHFSPSSRSRAGDFAMATGESRVRGGKTGFLAIPKVGTDQHQDLGWGGSPMTQAFNIMSYVAISWLLKHQGLAQANNIS